ncbi:MAG: sporulation protein [Oscillospiraceae bacterium]|nr:sporulation protein [Oscillospiraceae bacterium]
MKYHAALIEWDEVKSMRRRILPTLGLLGVMALLLLCSADAAQAVRDALALCVQSVIPALFPFFVVSSLFIDLGCAAVLGRSLAPIMRRLFGVSGAGGTAFLLGIIGGYPVGGRTAGELYRSGQCEREECERLLAFCNNAGPSFILGIAGLGCFGSVRVGAWLYLIHVGAAVMVGLLFRSTSRQMGRPEKTETPRRADALIEAVRGGAMSMVSICAFVVFFLVILRLFSRFTGIQHGAILGIVEMTNGILRLANDRRGFIWAAGLLGWGGLSVHCQTAAVLSGSGLSLKRYFIGKALQAAISMAAAWPVSLLLP